MNNIEVVLREIDNSLDLQLSVDNVIKVQKLNSCEIYIIRVDDRNEIQCTIYFETNELLISTFEDEECTEDIMISLDKDEDE